VISFLRFVGLMNAAIWLGAAVFYSLAAGPAAVSPDMEQLLGAKNFPYFSGAFAQIVLARYFIFLGASGAIALAHLVAEWLYMGRPARRVSTILLGGLLALVLIGGVWIEPQLNRLHSRRYAANAAPVEQAAAARAYRFWQAGLAAINVLMMAGLVFYVWRIANPSDAPRFISSVKFRG
jgi:hypothetical protein